jgi:hypothetical protein
MVLGKWWGKIIHFWKICSVLIIMVRKTKDAHFFKIVQVDGIIILVNNTVPSRKDQNFIRHEAQKDRGYEVVYA